MDECEVHAVKNVSFNMHMLVHLSLYFDLGYIILKGRSAIRRMSITLGRDREGRRCGEGRREIYRKLGESLNFWVYLPFCFAPTSRQIIYTNGAGLEAIERLCFLASLPLAGTGQREGDEKTQPFIRFQPHLGSWENVITWTVCGNATEART